ncbi:unnamed protein product [Rotaria sp. Silwood2]|nr:unnamed protein product [Rotaria sp. Silwood2]
MHLAISALLGYVPVKNFIGFVAAKLTWIKPGSTGEYLDNLMGGNPNSTIGQIVGGYPGVGVFDVSHGFGGGHGFGGSHRFGGLAHSHQSSHFSHFSHYGSTYGYSMH